MTSPPSVVVYYLDASAFVKRYTTETGSGGIGALCQPATGTLITTCLKARAMQEFHYAVARHLSTLSTPMAPC